MMFHSFLKNLMCDIFMFGIVKIVLVIYMLFNTFEIDSSKVYNFEVDSFEVKIFSILEVEIFSTLEVKIFNILEVKIYLFMIKIVYDYFKILFKKYFYCFTQNYEYYLISC